MIGEKCTYLLRLRRKVIPVVVEITVRDFVPLFSPPFFEAQLPRACVGISVTQTERGM